MEHKFNFDSPPTLMYFEFSDAKGKYFQVFQDGKLLDDVIGISLLHAENKYSLDFERAIGFNNEGEEATDEKFDKEVE